jgi:hypothetical protein
VRDRPPLTGTPVSCVRLPDLPWAVVVPAERVAGKREEIVGDSGYEDSGHETARAGARWCRLATQGMKRRVAGGSVVPSGGSGHETARRRSVAGVI